MERVELYKRMLEEERISEEELLAICTEEELDAIFPSNDELVVEREKKLVEILSLIQVRDAYNKSTAIGYSTKSQDKVLDIINKSILKLLEESYGE